MTKKLQIRNSTADFLVFTKENNSADTIEVRVQDGNVWLTPKAIGQLFDIYRSVVTKHLQNVFCRWGAGLKFNLCKICTSC